MPQIHTDRDEVRVALEQLLDEATRNGVELHPSMRIVESDGDVTVHVTAANGEQLMSIPEASLVPVGAAEWDVEGEVLIIRHHDPSASAHQRHLAHAVVNVYNATGKLRSARQQHPRAVFLHDPAVLPSLRALRPRLFETGLSTVDVFIETRTLTHLGAPWLMPIVDFLNHDRSAEGLLIERGRLTVPVSTPAGDTECYVSYGPRRDALDLALNYGYLDAQVPFARSCPIELDLDDVGIIEVAGDRLPPVAEFDAPRLRLDDARLTISHLTFVPGRPQFVETALRLAVEALLRKRGSNEDPDRTAREVGAAIVRQNLERLVSAREVVRTRHGPAARMVLAALEVQHETIRRSTTYGV